MHHVTHDRSDRIDRAALCRRAHDAFVHTFGTEPTAGAVAPGRVNLIGEHTDYNDGFVLPMAIDRAIVVAAALRTDGPWRVVSQTLNCRTDADPDADPQTVAPFARYVLGVAAALTERGATLPAVDLLIDSTLPPGGGLSSSAALTVATCMSLEQLSEFTLDPHDRARCCQHVEHVYAGTPCGIMDQLACILGRRDHALRIDCRSLDVRAVRLPPNDEIIWLVVDCGERHTLADSAYTDRQRDCRAVAALLGVPSLRAADTAALAGTWLAPRLRDRAQHVVEENERVDRFIASLERRDWAVLGSTMFESHDSLRALYDVSCPALDAIVDAAGVMVDRGVVGARMTGGGFGGCAIVACRSEAAPDVVAGLADVAGASAVSRVCASDGASVVAMASEPGL